MNREIKFRAWDGNQLVSSDYGEEDFMICANGDIGYLTETGGYYTYKYFAYHIDWKLMQFTGFYDKENKEVYEGDIIEVMLDGRTFNGYVDWDYGSFTLKESFITHYRWMDMEIIKVIGNIYENPQIIDNE